MSRVAVVPLQRIQQSILFLRDRWVMLDSDLAEVYGVKTYRLNEQVRRNRKRFPPHFLFRLTRMELDNLRSQDAISSWGGRRTLPHAFTEAGAVMAANVLKTPLAVELSVQVVEAFVRLTHAATANPEILRRIDELERTTRAHDARFKAVFVAIRKLILPVPSAKPKRGIGFHPPTSPTKT